MRFAIFRRDGFACRYCGGMAPTAKLVVDHVVPVARGGSGHHSNLITACFECNAGKAAGEASSYGRLEISQDNWDVVGNVLMSYGLPYEDLMDVMDLLYGDARTALGLVAAHRWLKEELAAIDRRHAGQEGHVH